MSEYTYVGVTPRFLSTGRPITFGTVLEESDLELVDDATRADLVPAATAAPAPAPAPAAPAPAPAADTPAPAPAPKEVVTTGNPS